MKRPCLQERPVQRQCCGGALHQGRSVRRPCRSAAAWHCSCIEIAPKAISFRDICVAEKEGFDSRLRARSGSALTLHWSVIHSRPFKSLQISTERYKNRKKQKNRKRNLPVWRRRRDSNPRDAFDAYTISSRAPSTKLGDFSTIFICSHRTGQALCCQQMIL